MLPKAKSSIIGKGKKGKFQKMAEKKAKTVDTRKEYEGFWENLYIERKDILANGRI
jgi:hypothetical protein